jgi:hypothetical protein
MTTSGSDDWATTGAALSIFRTATVSWSATVAHPLNTGSGRNLIAQAGVAEHDLDELPPNLVSERMMISEILERLVMGQPRAATRLKPGGRRLLTQTQRHDG